MYLYRYTFSSFKTWTTATFSRATLRDNDVECHPVIPQLLTLTVLTDLDNGCLALFSLRRVECTSSTCNLRVNKDFVCYVFDLTYVHLRRCLASVRYTHAGITDNRFSMNSIVYCSLLN